MRFYMHSFRLDSLNKHSLEVQVIRLYSFDNGFIVISCNWIELYTLTFQLLEVPD